MRIKLGSKFSEQHIDKFINSFYENYIKNPSDSYVFDLTDTEWISNQGLLLLTGIIKYLHTNNSSFEVIFVEKGISTLKVDERKAKLIIQIWDIWRIWRLFPNLQDCERYIGITDSYVTSLKKVHSINYSRTDVYGSYDITPFVLLNYQQKWNDDNIIEYLSEYHRLNDATIDIVAKHNCAHPFLTNLFGEIVSKELYENFLQHFDHTFFKTKENYSFFSINLNGEINKDYSSQFIQDKLAERLKEEELPECSSFFKDKNTGKFHNRPFINYSFLDFGEGIVNTLRDEYRKVYGTENNDSDILKFAFRHDSSRNPIKNVFENERLKDYIPRGLFDILSIVKRYHGLLIVRSCRAKILYDFSSPDSSIEKAFSTFGDAGYYFPGTFITLYLPAIQNEDEVDMSNITPILPDYPMKKEYRVINIENILKKVESQKDEDKYTTLYSEIHSLLSSENKTLTFLSFDNLPGNQIFKKIIFFLVSSYDVNLKNNFIILNPPKKEFLQEINNEIFMLSQINRNYKIHSLPFVYYNQKENDISLYWLGIYNQDDVKKLDELLYNEITLSKNDFEDKNNIIGHLLSYDKHGNVISNLPDKDTLTQIYQNPYKFVKAISYNQIAESIIEKITILCKSSGGDCIYLCNGNYYQSEYIELAKLLINKEDRKIIAKALFSLLEISIEDNIDINKYKFISITSSSHSITNSWIELGLVKQNNILLLDNYNDVSDLSLKLQEDCEKYKYILVCDIIATGYLSERIENILVAHKCKLDRISVVVNSMNPAFLKSDWCINNKDRIIAIYDYPLDRYERSSEFVKPYIQNKKIIRINPYTNVPITQRFSETNTERIIFKKKEFLKYIDDKYVQIGLLKFNNILHPYFFNTEKIIKEIGTELLESIFSNKSINVTTENLTIFYPKKSDISHLNFKAFKAALGDKTISEYELERHNTEDGWKFPHTTDYFKKIVRGNPVLLLDDGSCTGSSLIQMINEVSHFLPSHITVFCLIGRVGEHQREFLSLINRIEKNGVHINVDFYWGTHWHIPTYYPEDNPFIKESNWFNQVVNNIPNIPSKIKKIITHIDEQLQPQQNRNEFKDYKFLPKLRTNSPYTDIKKEIINTRDEIGNIIDYRFYVESFDWFNDFMQKYESKESNSNRYQKIELLCAAIAYEPHLFKKIRMVLPDVVEKLQEFIETIIWGNPNKGRVKLSMESLIYEWNKRDIINLLFIVFNSKELKERLTVPNFKQLIAFSPSLNYVLYRLLKYFPLSVDKFTNDDFDSFLKDLLTKVCDKDSNYFLDDKKQRTEIKKYIRFLNTLPDREDFDSQIDSLRINYLDQEKHEIHHLRKSFNHNITWIISHIRNCIAHIKNGNEILDSDIREIRSFWFSIFDFINPILSFCFSYKGFISPFPYRVLVRDEEELRRIINKCEGVIFSLTTSFKEVGKLELLDQDICKIQGTISDKSDFQKLFSSQKCSIDYIVTELYYQISELKSQYEVELDNPDIEMTKLPTKLPKYYADKLIISEIISNIKNYAQDGENAKISINTNINLKGNCIDIKIINAVKKDNLSNGGNEGTNCLDLLSNFQYFKFKFDGFLSEDGTKYIQTINFTLN